MSFGIELPSPHVPLEASKGPAGSNNKSTNKNEYMSHYTDVEGF